MKGLLIDMNVNPNLPQVDIQTIEGCSQGQQIQRFGCGSDSHLLRIRGLHIDLNVDPNLYRVDI